jgi:hypothetical protein
MNPHPRVPFPYPSATLFDRQSLRFSSTVYSIHELIERQISPGIGRFWLVGRWSLAIVRQPLGDEPMILLQALRRVVRPEMDVVTLEANDPKVLRPVEAILGWTTYLRRHGRFQWLRK